MSYGERIKKEREKQRLTQDELADLAHISLSYIGDIERGKKTPSIEVFQKISRALGRPVDFFLSDPSSWENQVDKQYFNMIETSGVESRHRKELFSVTDINIKEAFLAVFKRLNMSGFSVLTRRLFRDSREIFIDGHIEREIEVEIEITGEEAQFYAHRYIQSYDHRGTGYYDFKVEVISSEVPTGETRLQIGKIDPNFIYYRIRFIPPLRKKDVASFKIQESYDNAHVMTHTRLLKLMDEGKLLEDRPLERSGSLIMYPTTKLAKRIVFPKGYKLKNAFFEVAVNRVKQPEEKNRLLAANAFKYETVNDKQVCELVVDNALQGCNYLIFWEPPSEEEYQKLLGNQS
jgi:transcriptional regulator with XRE-family HTH domain